MARASKPDLGSPAMLPGRSDTELETSQVTSRELNGGEWAVVGRNDNKKEESSREESVCKGPDVGVQVVGCGSKASSITGVQYPRGKDNG